MAVIPSEKLMIKKSQEVVSSIYEYPLRCCSCYRLLKPEAGIVAEQYSLDVFPVLLERASFPLRINCPCGSSQGQNLDTISGTTQKGSISQPFPSQLALLKLLEIPSQHKNKICSNTPWINQSYKDVPWENAAKASYGISIDVGDECLDAPEINGRTPRSMLQNEGVLNKVLLRKSSMQKGAKVLQFLWNPLLNCSSKDNETADERGFRMSSYRWRRCKHVASYDPRKIVIFFSILSSLGTMVLIYLTLRIQQFSDRPTHV